MFRVLIVEDEEIVRQGLILTTDWHSYGVEVIGEATNGQEGYDLALKLNPDIIITDIKMPKKSGLEMIKELSEKTNIAFIVISAFNEFEYAKEALKLGAVDYLLKPFKDEELEVAITKAKDYVRQAVRLNTLEEDNRSDVINKLNTYLSETDKSTHSNMMQSIRYIKTNYDKDISISSLAEYLQVSESTVTRMFRSESSYTFQEYLTLFRIREACKLLNDPSIKVYEVADKVGYSDQRYFSNVFKKTVGVSPKTFKERYR